MFYKMKNTIFLGITNSEETHQMTELADKIEKFYREEGYLCSRLSTPVSTVIDVYQYKIFTTD